MVRAETGADRDVHAEAWETIEEMRATVESGYLHWFHALLQAIRRWPLPFEMVGDRPYRYLVGGEAFDWLLLAERLCTEIADIAPEEEIEALLFHEQLPVETPEEEFQELLGAKYKAHLNFIYGVRVEAALQMAVTEEVSKEHRATLIWERSGRADEELYQRIYGRTRDDLLAEFRAATQAPDPEWMSLADLSDWRYWLFKYRIQASDPEKVASDTRKGVALLQRLDLIAKRKRSNGTEPD